MDRRIYFLDTEMKGIRGTLKIAAPESLTVFRLESILKEYRKKFPHASIRLSNASCGDNKKAIVDGSADVAFVMLLQFEDLVIHPLMNELIVLVGSSDCSLNILDKSYENQKIRECLIVNEKEGSYRRIFEEFLRDRGIVPSNIMELWIWSIEAIKRSVMSGLGIAYLPLMTVNDEIEAGRLKIIPCEADLKQIYSQVVYHKNKWVSPALLMFIDITLKHATDWSCVETTC